MRHDRALEAGHAFLFAKGGEVQIIKKINNNFVIARDSTGEEVIVRGKGLGFQKLPYELDDLSLVERTYYDVDTRFATFLNEIDDDEFIVANAICDKAKSVVRAELSPNLIFTLADHLHFSIERLRQGMLFSYPLEYEIRQAYASEMSVGEYALQIIEEWLGWTLPADEAVGFAMNVINAETSQIPPYGAGLRECIEGMTRIIETRLDVNIDRSSADFTRFVAHVRYLLNRAATAATGAVGPSDGAKLYSEIRSSNPELNDCAQHLMSYLSKRTGLPQSDDETLYLMLHVSRLVSTAHLKQ